MQELAGRQIRVDYATDRSAGASRVGGGGGFGSNRGGYGDRQQGGGQGDGERGYGGRFDNRGHDDGESGYGGNFSG